MHENLSIHNTGTEVSIMSGGKKIWGMIIEKVADTVVIVKGDKPVSEWVTHLDEKNG